MALPVLPLEASTIVSPGLRRPSLSAFSNMYLAMRAFIDPDGLRYSSLAHTPSKRTSGVFPMPSNTLAALVPSKLARRVPVVCTLRPSRSVPHPLHGRVEERLLDDRRAVALAEVFDLDLRSLLRELRRQPAVGYALLDRVP